MCKRIVAATCLVLLSCPVGSAQNWPKLVEGSRISLEKAVARGLEESGDGVVFHVELELDHGKPVYSVDVAQGRKTCNVIVDASSGVIVEKEIEEEDHSDVVKAARVGIVNAIKTAMTGRVGTPVEAELVLESGKPVFRISVFAASECTMTLVDGVHGARIGGASAAPRAAGTELEYTSTFEVAETDWVSSGVNPYFVLEPGFFLVLEGMDDGKLARLTITVLPETRRISGVETRVVEEREELGGEIVEVSRNYFALCKRTNNVYYFGEEVDIYRAGKVASHDGAWLSGENGARFGLIMPGSPLLGTRYYQEIAPDVAMDRAQVVGLGETFECAAGRFDRCLRTLESTPLEKGQEYKIYAFGIGLVQDAELRLTRYGRSN